MLFDIYKYNVCSQEHFTCIRPADWAGDCSDTEKFIDLNKQFGQPTSESEEKTETDSETSSLTETSNNDSQEANLSNVNPATNQRPFEKSFTGDSEQALPESESLSYGLFNVQDPIVSRSDSESIAQEDVLQNSYNNSLIPSEVVDVLTFDIPTTTEDSNDHSTVIWNMYTESLYDGSTIDDIVEVNAVDGLQSIESTTIENSVEE